MNSGASLTSGIRRATRVQSSSVIEPERMWCSATRASAESRRMAISLRPISSEKITLGSLCWIEQARAKSSARVDFPIAGRAAMTIIWPGWSPLVSASKSAKPVGTPDIWPLREPIDSISSRAPSMMSASGA